MTKSMIVVVPPVFEATVTEAVLVAAAPALSVTFSDTVSNAGTATRPVTDTAVAMTDAERAEGHRGDFDFRHRRTRA